MADNNLQGFRQTYQETGKLSSGGGPDNKSLDAGASGSHRDNNWKRGAAQAKLANAKPIGPYNNLKGTSGSLY
jgi:hypothetical protein